MSPRLKTYDYTLEGPLSRRTWARGITTDYAYDIWSSLTNIVYSDETPSVLLRYDAMGRQTNTVVNGVLTNIFFYSVHGQLTNEVQNGVVLSRTYDSLNRPTGYSLQGEDPLRSLRSLRLKYSYDTLGRFCGVGFNAEAQSLGATGGTRSRASAAPTLSPLTSNLSPVTFTYSYLPGTDLVSGYTSGNFSRSVAYEPHRNLISAVTNSFNSSTPPLTNPPTQSALTSNLSSFTYTNDSLGRRTAITRGGAAFGDLSGATDAYGYNDRSEVVSSRRTMDGAEVRGFDYDYAYDPIGNRTSATDYDEQGNALVSSYTANALNQYTQRTVPGYAAIRGEAATNATVTVNERPTFRQGSYFYGGDVADNTTSSVLKDLEVYAAINPPGNCEGCTI